MPSYPEPQIGDLWQYRDGGHHHFLVMYKRPMAEELKEYRKEYYCEVDLYCLETGMSANLYLFPKHNVYWGKVS